MNVGRAVLGLVIACGLVLGAGCRRPASQEQESAAKPADPPASSPPQQMLGSADARPNILLLVAEDLGQELGCYGNRHVQTPHLDELARQGVLVRQAFVTQAGCSQSRASYLTGLYPHQHGQLGLATWGFRLYSAEQPNLVRALRDAGYRTGILGKLHVAPEAAFPFDTAELPSSNFRRKNLGELVRRTKSFIEHSPGPFFLALNLPDAHRPFLDQVDGVPANPLAPDQTPPLPQVGLDSPNLRQQTAGYYNSISRLDHYIGRILEVLEETNRFDNTLIVFLGDHGADLLRGKRTSYEGGLRIPLILRWAKGWKSASRIERLVSTVDLMPTLLEIAGVPAPELPGRSLVPLIKAASAPWRSSLFSEFHAHSAHDFYPQRTVRDERFKLIENLLSGEENPGYAYTTQKYFPDFDQALARAPKEVRAAYERMRKPPAYELYDLARDPYEWNDLSADPQHRAVLDRLSAELQRWRTETQDPLLHPAHLRRLQGEITASFVAGEPQKDLLQLHYPDYFFAP